MIVCNVCGKQVSEDALWEDEEFSIPVKVGRFKAVFCVGLKRAGCRRGRRRQRRFTGTLDVCRKCLKKLFNEQVIKGRKKV